MKTHIIEATNGPQNWGKFLIGILDTEYDYRSAVNKGVPLLSSIGWDEGTSLWVLDLQTCEGAAFRHGGSPKHDLEKHRVWVCPMFEPFLEWLYQQPRAKVMALDLPQHIDLPDAEFQWSGYRRAGVTPGSDPQPPQGDAR